MKRFPWVIITVLFIVVSSMLLPASASSAQTGISQSPVGRLIDGADSVIVGTVVESDSY